MEYSIERLETLSNEHLMEIADLTTKAFAGDVSYAVMLGDDLSLSTEYCNALLRAAILEGEVYILTIEKGGKREIATWAVFYPPGCALFGTEAQRKLGFNEFFKKLKPEVQDWYTNTYPKYIAEFADKVFTKEEQKLFWWCYTLATRPDLQRKGFGTALINVGYQKAEKTKELGTFLGLGTLTKNVNTYISMGFKEVGKMECQLPRGHSMPSMSTHAMIRKP